jgi:uridine kinase
MSQSKPYVVGVAGGSGSGKTSVCNKLVEQLGADNVVVLQVDSFYKSLTVDELKNVSEHNFDHPDAIEHELVIEALTDLIDGKSANIPIYDFKTHSRQVETHHVESKKFIIVEGIFGLYYAGLRKYYDLQVFIDVDSDVCILRRIKRDIEERGRTFENVSDMYLKFVKPSFDAHIFPTKKFADIIIPRGRDNEVAINLVAAKMILH